MIFVNDRRFEVEANAIFFPNYGDALVAVSGLQHRHWELAAREEARLLVVHGDQVWLRKFTEGAFGAQHLQHCRGVERAIEKQDVKCRLQECTGSTDN